MSTCNHSCNGLCHALAAIKQSERQAIALCEEYIEVCDYPDVRVLLSEIGEEHERMLRLLEEKSRILEMKLRTLDDIRESFL